MRSLSRILELVKAQLSGFSLAARALIASLLAVMVLSLVLVAQFTGRAEFVPLGLGPSVDEQVRAQAAAYLDTMRIPYEVRANDFWVPVDDKYRVFTSLTERGTLAPEGIDFNTLLQDPSPFTDRETKRQQYNVARINEVERMISNFRAVRDATVVIDSPTGQRGLGRARVEPTASVEVDPVGPSLTAELANTIARVVAGSYAELKVENVQVADRRTGIVHKGVSDDDMVPALVHAYRANAEAHIERKIREHYPEISGLQVAVAVAVDNTRETGRRTSVQKPVTGVNREASRESSSENTYVPREPGVRGNVGANVRAGGGRTSSRTESAAETGFTPVFPNEQSTYEDPAGELLKVNASLRVPRSYFEAIWRRQTGAEADAQPVETDLAPIRTTTIETMREQVSTLVDTTGTVDGAVAGTVAIHEYDDGATLAAGGATGGAAGSGRGAGVVGRLVNEGLISTTAVVLLGATSLGLMFMMVRKATRQDELPSAEELVGIPPALAEAGDDLVGEAEETDASMEGLEIGEDEVRRQQMLEQINQLAGGSPEEAASLIRKWIRLDEVQ